MIRYWLAEPFHRVYLTRASVPDDCVPALGGVRTNNRVQHVPWSQDLVALADRTVHILLSPYAAFVRCCWIAPDPPNPALTRWHQAIFQGDTLWIGRARSDHEPPEAPFLLRLMF